MVLVLYGLVILCPSKQEMPCTVYANDMHMEGHCICPMHDHLSLQHLQFKFKGDSNLLFWNQHILKYINLELMKISAVKFSLPWEISPSVASWVF